jgi:hypothetical protein
MIKHKEAWQGEIEIMRRGRGQKLEGGTNKDLSLSGQKRGTG